MAADRDKLLIEAAARVLEAAGGSLPVTSLNKALFYLDLFALRDLGDPVTGNTYIALPAGPVVAKYNKRLVAALEEQGLAEQDLSGESDSKPVCLTALPEHQRLSEDQLRLVQRIGKWAATKTATALSDLSHQNAGWRLAWDRGLGAKRPALPINLSIAMQQIVDADPWLDELPTADVARAFSEVETEPGEPF